MTEPSVPNPAASEPSEDHVRSILHASHVTLARLAGLPRSLGWALLVGGLVSEVAVGIPPFWILGILILWPGSGLRLLAALDHRAPKSVKGGLGFINRFLDDLHRRYP